MVKVFLSHSTYDKWFVRRLAEDIKQSGAEIWLDEADILPGESIRGRIIDGIQRADFHVVCLSEHSISSEWVQEELQRAIAQEQEAGQARVIPVLLEGMEKEHIPPALQEKLYVDFRTPALYDEGFRKLFRKIAPDAAYESTLHLDSDRKNRLIKFAKEQDSMDWAVNYLIHVIQSQQDGTQRYWAYIALGSLGGKAAQAAIRKGLEDKDDFARSGALAGTTN